MLSFQVLLHFSFFSNLLYSQELLFPLFLYHFALNLCLLNVLLFLLSLSFIFQSFLFSFVFKNSPLFLSWLFFLLELLPLLIQQKFFILPYSSYFLLFFYPLHLRLLLLNSLLFSKEFPPFLILSLHFNLFLFNQLLLFKQNSFSLFSKFFLLSFLFFFSLLNFFLPHLLLKSLLLSFFLFFPIFFLLSYSLVFCLSSFNNSPSLLFLLLLFFCWFLPFKELPLPSFFSFLFFQLLNLISLSDFFHSSLIFNHLVNFFLLLLFYPF